MNTYKKEALLSASFLETQVKSLPSEDFLVDLTDLIYVGKNSKCSQGCIEHLA